MVAYDPPPTPPEEHLGIPITDLMRKLVDIVERFEAEGEVKILIDLFGVPGACVLHIPLPGPKL